MYWACLILSNILALLHVDLRPRIPTSRFQPVSQCTTQSLDLKIPFLFRFGFLFCIFWRNCVSSTVSASRFGMAKRPPRHFLSIGLAGQFVLHEAIGLPAISFTNQDPLEKSRKDPLLAPSCLLSFSSARDIALS
ncbi:hypothetical protein N431DRAFT_139454 [Stipitochalara longipes BDJ]|nr:hypothetical protein N431DRAFT_139454 [Stipitochalara longipes BDJ]